MSCNLVEVEVGMKISWGDGGRSQQQRERWGGELETEEGVKEKEVCKQRQYPAK